MATSSITENIYVDNSQVMVEYINAMETVSDRNDTDEIRSNVATNPEILQNVFSKGLKRHSDR